MKRSNPLYWVLWLLAVAYAVWLIYRNGQSQTAVWIAPLIAPVVMPTLVLILLVVFLTLVLTGSGWRLWRSRRR